MSRTLFVFGSNLAGKHYGGAAAYAARKYGAVIGVGEGETGESYALPTMDENFIPLALTDISERVERLKAYAAEHPELNFYVTRVACGIAGFKDGEIAPLFIGSPSNCTFDPLWSDYKLPAWKEAL